MSIIIRKTFEYFSYIGIVIKLYEISECRATENIIQNSDTIKTRQKSSDSDMVVNMSRTL